jgi:hypothetical protein
MIKYERMKVLNKIIRDLDINIASCFQAVRRGLAMKEANYPSTPVSATQNGGQGMLGEILFTEVLHAVCYLTLTAACAPLDRAKSANIIYESA